MRTGTLAMSLCRERAQKRAEMKARKKLLRLKTKKAHPSHIPPDERQQFILKCLAKGMSGLEIADEAGTSLNAVAQWIEKVKRKIGAVNAPHAVAIMKDWEIAELKEEIIELEKRL